MSGDKKGGSWWLKGMMIIIVLYVCMIFYPDIKLLFESKEEQALEAKIENVESFYNEAKALSLSMPLLSDSVVVTVADSLLSTLVDLNRAWVIFVSTQEGFENYTPEIEKLNTDVDKLRVEYGVVIGFRLLNNRLRHEQYRQRQWEEKKKKKTFI